MSSSGLIYAVIVGAWAAYLVPMWLRRQDELNDARPTERFSTAIRLLSGRAAMERRYAKGLDVEGLPGAASDDAHAPRRTAADADPGPAAQGRDEAGAVGPDDETDVVDVRAFAQPATMSVTVTDALSVDPAVAYPAVPLADAPAEPAARAAEPGAGPPGRPGAAGADDGPAERSRRAKALARRRRTTVILFLAFTIGAVVAAVGGVAFLWAPVGPAALLSAYIVYLRVQERRRFAFTMDQRRAELAAQRLREQRGRAVPGPARPAAPGPQPGEGPTGGPDPDRGPTPDRGPDRPAAPRPAVDRSAPERRGPDRPGPERRGPERRGPARPAVERDPAVRAQAPGGEPSRVPASGPGTPRPSSGADPARRRPPGAGMPRQPAGPTDQPRPPAPGDTPPGQPPYEAERGARRPPTDDPTRRPQDPARRAPDDAPARRAQGGDPGRRGPGEGAARRAPGDATAPPPVARSAHAADRRALVEQTDHAEWVDERERERGGATGESWDPIPVPLPTYVTAPVAPRARADADLGAPDGWSPARSSAAEPTDAPPEPVTPTDVEPSPPPGSGPPPRRPTRDRGRTPLFDQYADEPHPRAANE
ncbi:gephyrin-like molybdotransferase receptor GlpR [Streptomyces sp. NPDC057702]|uniref:divisome protein SepX/GlpR n=1 Tax=unclassified Streptomyces TaxID=2593676 RepID=UPI00367F29D8